MATLMNETIYFTPQPGKRKAFFPSFLHPAENFYKRSREDAEQPPERCPEEPADPPQTPGGPIQPAAGQGAPQEEVDRSPRRQAQGHVQPDVPVPQDDPTKKQGAAGPQPEQQIQSALEPLPGQGEAQPAEQVIKQTHPRPQGQAQAQGGGLGGDRNRHPRKSRPSRPPRGGSSSS